MAKLRHYIYPAEQNEFAISAARLRGRQSVRATFRLPTKLIELLGIIADQFGVKQKSLFDQLIDNLEILNQVADYAARTTPGKKERRPKTFVLSKQSLLTLEKVAAERQISRDILMEMSIRRLFPVLQAESEKQRKRAKVLREMELLLKQGHQLQEKTEQLLGKADPASEMVGSMIGICDEKVKIIAEIVAKGKNLEKIRVAGFSWDEESGG